MWKQFFDFATQLFTLTQETRNNREDIRKLQQEVKELTAVMQRMVYEIHRVGDHEKHEREMIALRLENQMLKFERRLLPGQVGEENKPE